MGESGKIETDTAKVKRCIECSGAMELAAVQVGDLSAEGYRCRECGHEVLTLAQMKEHERRRDLARAFAKPRKVVRVGNSVGLTLPKELFRVGQEFTVHVLDGHSLRIDLDEAPDMASRPARKKKSKAA
jgi:hypothetical protein